MLYAEPDGGDDQVENSTWKFNEKCPRHARNSPLKSAAVWAMLVNASRPLRTATGQRTARAGLEMPPLGGMMTGKYLMEYILHIGLPKTGSTSLQMAFSGNRASLLQHGVIYPKMGSDSMKHGPLRRVLWGRKPPESEGLPVDWMEQFHSETIGADICILSDDIFTYLDPEVITSLIPRERTRVVMYVREPVAHAASFYQQAVRNRNMDMSLRDYAESWQLMGFGVAKRWSHVFGKENVMIRLYGRDYGPWDIVSDFSELIGLKREDAIPSLECGANPGIAGNLLFVKRVLNRFITYKENRTIWREMEKLKWLDRSFRGKIPVGQETVDMIAQRSREDLNGFERLFGISVIPRDNPINAAPCPDHDKLEHDFLRIQAWAHERKNAMVPLLERVTGMFASDGSGQNM